MFGNRVRETTTTTGTGNVTLAGAVTNYVTCNAKFGLNRRFAYWIEDDVNNAWEEGIGYLSATTTLVRDTIKDNSLGTTALINFAAGTKTVRASPSESSLIATLPFVRNAATAGKTMRPANWRGSNGTEGGLTANRLALFPFLYLQSEIVTSLKVRVSTAVAASKARVGVWEIAPDGEPGQLILESGDLDTTTLGLKSSAVTATRITAGWYWVGLLADAAVGMWRYEAGNAPACSPHSGASGEEIFGAYDDVAAGWTTLPASPVFDGDLFNPPNFILLGYA